jgi:hypothetical protein
VSDDTDALDLPDPYTLDEFQELAEDDPEAAMAACDRELAGLAGMTLSEWHAFQGSN